MYDVLKDSDMNGIFESVTEISSANAYKINVNFSHRFRVWKTEILPGRLRSIKMEHSVEYIHRMIDLLLIDGSRLTDRAIHENIDTIEVVINSIDTVMEKEISMYLVEIDRIKLSKGD